MATLQKIRNHGVFLLVIVAFILGDLLNSGSSFFNRRREYVGEIAGQKIHYTDYESAIDQLTNVYKMETGRSDFDEDMTAQIRNQVWQMMLMDYTLQAQAKEIGMAITADELTELCIGANPHSLIQQRRAFYNENGQFDKSILVRFHSQIFGDNSDLSPEQQANIDQWKSYWMYWENAVRLTYMQEKYTGLLQKLFTANKIDAKYAYEGKQTTADADYVVKPYTAIAKRKIYNERKPLYKQEPNRSIEYVTFAIVPSQADFENVQKAIEAVQEEFATTDNVALVVNSNSDEMYNPINYSETTVPEQYKEFAFNKNAKKGDVTEIQFNDNVFSMARIVECGYSLPDSVELKVVLPDSITDAPEAQWYTEAQLSKDIVDKAFYGKKGQQFTIAQGLDSITLEITDMAKATPKVKLAILTREVSPSSKTYSQLYNEAKQFVVKNNNEDLFRGTVAEEGWTLYPAYNLDKNANKVGDLKSSRPIVRWAYEAKEGAVSDVFECGDRFVVALLSEVNDEDYRTMADVDAELTMLAIKQKKAEMIKSELKNVNSLAQAAEVLGSPVQQATAVTFGGYRFGNAGNEPAAIGAAIALNEGELSEPIEGNNGVYVLQVAAKNKADGAFDEQAEIQQWTSRYAYSLPYQAISMLQDKADVTDNRATFQ